MFCSYVQLRKFMGCFKSSHSRQGISKLRGKENGNWDCGSWLGLNGFKLSFLAPTPNPVKHKLNCTVWIVKPEYDTHEYIFFQRWWCFTSVCVGMWCTVGNCLHKHQKTVCACWMTWWWKERHKCNRKATHSTHFSLTLCWDILCFLCKQCEDGAFHITS